MARTHHRKDHKRALSDRRFHQRIQASIKRAEDAAADRCYQITPDLDDHLRFDGDTKAGAVTTTVDGRPVEVASVAGGTVTLGEVPPKKSSVCVTADYRQLEQRVLASMSQEAYDLWKDRCQRHIQVLSDPEIKGPLRSAYKMRALGDLYGGPICNPMTSKDLEGARELIRKYWESYPQNSGFRVEITPHTKPSTNFFAQALAAGRLDASGNVFSQEALEKAFGPGFIILPDGSVAIAQQVRSDDPAILALNPEDPSQRRYISMGCDTGFPEVGKAVVVSGPPPGSRGPSQFLDVIGEAVAFEDAQLRREPSRDEADYCPRCGQSDPEGSGLCPTCQGEMERGMLRGYRRQREADQVRADATLGPVQELPAGFCPGVKTDLHGTLANRLVPLTDRAKSFTERCVQEGVTVRPIPFPEVLADYMNFLEGRATHPRVPPAFPHRIPSDPPTCSVCGAIWPCAIHSGTHHVELGWHKDPETGEPVFDEVSLCAGPDPNGLTTILPGNGTYRSYKEWMALSPEEYAKASGGVGIPYSEWLAQTPEEREFPYWLPAGQSMFDREAQEDQP